MGYNSIADITSIFIRVAVVASQSREITRNSNKIWSHSSSRSSIMVTIESPCMTSYFTNSNFGRICYRFRDIDA